MELTENQIQDLYKFTRKHYVEFYDVQTELVDHLANDIEQILEDKPKLSFEQARDISFRKFGVYGFMEVVEQKQKQLRKKYWKILWSFVKQWFQLPKIIVTLGLSYVFFLILQLELAEAIIAVTYSVVIIYAFYKVYVLRKLVQKKSKKWMLEEMLLIQGTSLAFVLITYPIHIVNINYDFEGGIGTILTSFLFALITIVAFISLEVIPKKAEDLLTKNYPEYKLSQNL